MGISQRTSCHRIGLAVALALAAVPASAQDRAPAPLPGLELTDWAHTDMPPRLAPTYRRSAPDGRAAFHVPRTVTAPATGAAVPATSAAEADAVRAQLATFGPWLARDGVSENAHQLIRAIADIQAHGLAPYAYELETLRRERDERERFATRNAFEAGLARLLLRLDSVLTAQPDNQRADEAERLNATFQRSFVRLATHLGQGVVDARATQVDLFRDVPRVDTDALLDDLAAGRHDVDSALAALMPQHSGYARLVEAMRTLLAERDRGRARTTVPEIGSLWVGHRHDDVMSIKRRLQETGDLAADRPLTPMFDAPLKLAVESFQARHGLPAAGIVDVRTRAALNIDVHLAIEQVAMNLERWRWMPRSLGERHFFMNLPSYRLAMMNGEQTIIDMPVVIGSTEHPTPTFSKDMTYVEVNPTWTVPASIAYAELLPRELARPGYLRSRNFDYVKYRDGRIVTVPYDSVTREMLQRRPFPLTLRQRGGPNNALGRMKFMMPNPYAIYLHDTQAKQHFTLDDRAYSHGCIRLGDPAHLLDVLLQVDGREPGFASALLAQPQTRRERLDTPMPTHLTYFTAWVDDDGQLQRRADVYRHDPALRIALQATDTLLSQPPGPALQSSTDRWTVSQLGD